MAFHARRSRIVYLGIVVTIILFLFYRSSPSKVDSHLAQDFYQKTVKAVDETRRAGQAVWNHAGRHDPHEAQTRDRDGDGDVDEDDKKMAQALSDRLKDAELRAKEAANSKAGWKPDPPSKVVGVGSAREGQERTGRKGRVLSKPKVDSEEAAPKKKANEKLEAEDEVYRARKEELKKEKAEAKAAKLREDDDDDDDDDRLTAKKPSPKKDQEQLAESDDVQAMKQVKRLMKKAPVVIFSKTYCPYSKRAKKLLLEKFSIKPAPLIVEIDEEENGPQLQDALQKLTGRRTVPNIVVNGFSLGGADEVMGLDEAGQLQGAVLKHGKSMVDIAERTVSTLGDEAA